MAQVLVLDPDRDVRSALAEALDLDGHRVLLLAQTFQALCLLRTSATSLVVVAGNQDPRNEGLAAFFAAVARDERLAGSHHYICLTTTPNAVPAGLHDVLAQLAAPLLAKPFALDELLAAVRHISSAAPRRASCRWSGDLPQR